MKCALVIPAWVPEDIFSSKTASSQINYWQPLGTLYVAAVLQRAGHEVRFFNGAFTTHEQILRELRPARGLGKLLYGPVAIRNYLFRQKGQAFCEAVTDVVAGNASYRGLAGRVLAHLKRLLPQDVVRLFSRVNAD